MNAPLHAVPSAEASAPQKLEIASPFAPAHEIRDRLLASRWRALVDVRFPEGATPLGSLEEIVHRLLPDRAALPNVDGPVFKTTFAILPEEAGIENAVADALLAALPGTELVCATRMEVPLTGELARLAVGSAMKPSRPRLVVLKGNL